MSYGHAEFLLVREAWLKECWAEIDEDVMTPATQTMKEVPAMTETTTQPAKTDTKSASPRVQTEPVFWELRDHDALLLKEGDRIPSLPRRGPFGEEYLDRPGHLLLVTKVDRPRGSRNQTERVSRTITLDNGKTFDAGADLDGLRKMTIFRPRAGF